MFDFLISQFSSDTRYASAVAHVRSLENQLIPFRKFVLMAEKNNWREVLEVLRSTDYYEALVEVNDLKDLQAALNQFIHQKHLQIYSLGIESGMLMPIIARHDVNNLKILLKNKWVNRKQPVIPSREGTIPSAEISRFIEKPELLPLFLKTIVQTALQDFSEHHSIFRAEMLMEKMYLENIKQVFDVSGIPFLKHFISYRLDWTNIIQILRWRKWQPAVAIDFSLLPTGGWISQDLLKSLYTEKSEALVSRLQFTPYGPAATAGLEQFFKTGELWQLEKNADEFLSNFCQLTIYTPFGVEPLIAYLWKTMQELKNLHLLLDAKRIGAHPQAIIARLRGEYV